MPASSSTITRGDVKQIIDDLLSHILVKNGFHIERFVPNPNPTRKQVHVRRTVDALIDDSSELFTNLGDQLHMTSDNIHVIFLGISDEIFVTGINWGRIVAFLAFGGSVMVHCANHTELWPFLDEISEWMTEYVENNLRVWVEAHGNWVCIKRVICNICRILGFVMAICNTEICDGYQGNIAII
jgi:apoptosis regulator BCL-W/BCL2-like 1 (apoptosis regulator Bcl-X)